MKLRIAAYLGFFTAMLIAANVEAGCRWTWDCTTSPCRQAQVCDSIIDPPAIRPPEIAPIPSPSIAPIPQPVIPPVGTSQCSPMYQCDAFGRCSWQQVCR